DLHATALTDDALEADALVLATGAFPVAGRTEDLLAEEPVLLRLQGAVVDGLGLLDLAVRPVADVVRGGETDAQLVEEVDVEHLVCVPVCSRVPWPAGLATGGPGWAASGPGLLIPGPDRIPRSGIRAGAGGSGWWMNGTGPSGPEPVSSPG